VSRTAKEVVALLTALVALLGLAGPAAAESVTVGSPLTGAVTDSIPYCHPYCITANVNIPEAGSHVTVPFDGTVTRLRLLDGSGPFRLRILRREGEGPYRAVAAGPVVEAAGTGVETYAAALPVKAGDLIGLEEMSLEDTLGYTQPLGSNFLVWFFYESPFPEEQDLVVPPVYQEVEIHEEQGFNVDVERPGGPPLSESAPPPANPGAPAASTKCEVPKLKGHKLAAAKKALLAAGCRAGKVTIKKGAGHPAKVVAQAPAFGKVRPAGTKVKLVLH
jgi:hypothetical protein